MPSTPRLSEYATNALETIRKELRMFSISDVQNASNATNGQQIPSLPTKVEYDLNMLLAQLMNSGFTEEQAITLIKNGRSDVLDNNKLVQLQQCSQRLPGIHDGLLNGMIYFSPNVSDHYHFNENKINQFQLHLNHQNCFESRALNGKYHNFHVIAQH